jgi:ubiquinone/menaquinone biosynthesis C-methylase UbiE
MNRFEKWFCGSFAWRFVSERRLLPWIVSGYSLGDHILEVGAGFGAVTRELRRRCARVTSLEYDFPSVARLAAKLQGGNAGVLQGDAATLPFPDKTFSSVVAILVLHHLRSREQQDRAFTEIHRVLKPAGVFLAFEIQDGWLQRLSHIKSTFVPVQPPSAFARLGAAGFSKIAVDFQRSAFRICALRARDS